MKKEKIEQKNIVSYDNKENKKEDSRIEIEIGEIELPKIDLTKYVGQKAKIVDAGKYIGNYGYYVKFETDIIDELGTEENPIKIKASVIFGLQVDENENIGWGKDTKLGLFLAKHKSKTIEGMIGKIVTIQLKTTKDSEYLTIV